MSHRLVLTAAFAASLSTALLAQITPGNVVVTRVGDGVNALSSAATAVFLEEYTVGGIFVQSIPLPTSASGNNQPVTNSGSATSEGALTQSADGRYLITVGYGTSPGTTAVVGTTSATVGRVIARTALDGTIDSSTALADAYSANNIRGATSLDGTQFWTAGTASATNGPGVRFVANLGDTASTQVSTSVTNIRRVDVVNGQLYCVTQSGAFVGVNTVGTGLPSMPGETISLLSGFPAASASPYDFFFADPSTLYVSDDRTSGAGGIQKWTESAGVWTLQYTLAPAANIGCRGLSGYLDNGLVTLFATATSNELVMTQDVGAGATFASLATAGTNMAFRGVRFVRTPASVTFSGTSCATTFGVPSVGASGSPVVGDLGFQLVAGNTPPVSFLLFALKGGQVSPIGFPVPGAPACALLYVLPDVLASTVSDGLGAASVALPIPANALLAGTEIAVQVAAFDLALVGFGLPIGTSQAMQLVIGN